MSGIPDLELTPDGEFADRLEQTLMAEMGFSAVAAISTTNSSSMRATGGHRPARRWIVATAATLVAAIPALLFVVQRSEAPSISRIVSPPRSPTSAPPSTDAPTTTEALPPGLPNGQLEAGVTYRLPRSTLGRSVQLINSVDGARALAATGGVVMTADQAGFEMLLIVVDLSNARFFTDPLVDAYAIPDDAGLTAATTEAPADFFAYFASLPGVEAGPITDAEIAGHPAKAMTWQFGEFDGGFACGPAPRCVNVGWLGQFISSYFAGNSGTTYLIDLDGQQVLVEVQDRPGAQETADSLVIAN